MSLPLVITNAGRAALINAANTGMLPVTISQVGVSASTAAVDQSTVAIAGEIKRLATFGGQVVAPDTLHISIRDESADTYSLNTFGLYLSDGTLFAAYSQVSVILEKAPASILLLAVDVVLADIEAADITFGSTEFLNPPATPETMGVLRMATAAEAKAGVDPNLGISPATLQAVLQALLPRGSIIDWYGTAATVPVGWRICDGTGGTPDMRNKFSMGAANDAALGTTGGSPTMTVTVQGTALTPAQLASHSHGGRDLGHGHQISQTPHNHTLNDGGHQHNYDTNHPALQGGPNGQVTFGGGSGLVFSSRENSNIWLDPQYANVAVVGSNANIQIDAAGGNQPHAHGATTTTNLPPYVALYKIMKL